MEKLKKSIAVANGEEKAALVLKNAQIINVFTEEILKGDIAIQDGKIVGIGEYEGQREMDLKGQYVVPGLIDAHVHIESSMVTPKEFAKAIVPRGTTTIIADPHEIANVCGIKGIEYMLKESEDIPLSVYMMLPSCVPSTEFENGGAILEACDLEKILHHPYVLGLGEVMDCPSVFKQDEKILKKIQMVKDRPIDGHAPKIQGKNLDAYKVAGIMTDHECSTIEEMIQRLRLGMYVQIREGSAAKDLKNLINGVTSTNRSRCLFCTDDRHPEDLLKEGHIDYAVKEAIKLGIDPIAAIKMATLNAAQCYGLKDLGAIAPGYKADLLVLEDLKTFKIHKIFKKGQCVAKDYKPLFEVSLSKDCSIMDTVHMKPIEKKDLEIPLNSDIVNVIRVVSKSLITKKVVRKVDRENGVFKFNEHLDILKMAVIERHHATGNIGLGFVENFCLKNGAIASTIAHDSHNMIVIGDNDEDMLLASRALNKCKGGISIVSKGVVKKVLPLPVAGLMSDESIENVNENLTEMLKIAHDLKVNPQIDPFMTLSFLALPVIPEIKLTDGGLFDVNEFHFLDIEYQ